jgi:quercetin dioxygenase-like cupin family protein
LAAGVSGRPLFGEDVMLNLIRFDPGATVPAHSHPHEQIGIVLEGMQALVVDSVAHELKPFEAYALPGGVEHSAYCGPEGALVLDVFAPVREDYAERWHAEGA